MGFHLGYRFYNQFSLVGMAGYHRFPAGSFPAGDTAGWWWNLSANLESEIVKKPLRVYIDIGPGIYLGKTGDLKPGFNMGLGAAYGLKGGWDIELGVDFHHIFTSGVPDPNFYVTYTRLVHRF
jgi:hypothetical protein